MKRYEEEERQAQDILRNYKYLDGLSTKGYVWEFARRTKTYIEAYQQLKEISKTPDPDYDDIAECLEKARAAGIESIITYGDPRPCSPLIATVKYTAYLDNEKTIPSPVPLYYSLPDYHVNYRSFTSLHRIGHPVQVIGRHRYRILLGLPEKTNSHEHRRNNPELVHVSRPYLFDSRYSKLCKPYSFLSTFLSPGLKGAEETIFVGISKTARREDLNRMVEDISQYLSKEKPRRVERKWKFYLIIYDLMRQGGDSANLEDVLPIIDDTFAEAKNIKNGYKAAVELIEKGQYKTLF